MVAQPKLEVRAAAWSQRCGLDWPRPHVQQLPKQFTKQKEVVIFLISWGCLPALSIQTRTWGRCIISFSNRAIQFNLNWKNRRKPQQLWSGISWECHKREWNVTLWMVTIPLGNETCCFARKSVRHQADERYLSLTKWIFLNPGHPATKRVFDETGTVVKRLWCVDGYVWLSALSENAPPFPRQIWFPSIFNQGRARWINWRRDNISGDCTLYI